MDKLTAAQQFFYEHAAHSWNPLTETEEQGRIRGARALADAEDAYLQAHRVADVNCRWEDDADGDTSAGNAEGPFEWACIMDGDDVLASLGGIDQPDDNYRRVVRAELAMECLDQLREIVEQAK